LFFVLVLCYVFEKNNHKILTTAKVYEYDKSFITFFDNKNSQFFSSNLCSFWARATLLQVL